MIDRTFSAALTFCMLVAAALAIASMVFGSPPRMPAAKAAHWATFGLSASGIRLGVHDVGPFAAYSGPAAHAAVKVVQLPTVVITAKRATPIAYAQTDETRAAARALQ